MKALITSLILFISLQGISQMAVTDATANVTLKSQLASSANQLTQLEKNYELLKSAEEKYEKVNSIITSVYKIGEIVDFQKQAIENVTLVMNNTKATGASRERLFKILNHALMSIAQRVETISNVLNGSFFKMTDKERIDMFKEERSAIFMQLAKTRGYANPYRNR